MYLWDGPAYRPDKNIAGRMPPGMQPHRKQQQRAGGAFAYMPEKLQLEKGTLVMRVLDAGTGKAIQGATVQVNGEGPVGAKQYYSVQSDANGFSPKMPLPTPAQKYSLEAGGTITPYYTYTVTVSKPGYKTQVYRSIQIFANTQCTHEALLARAPAGEAGRPEVVYTEPPHHLAR